MAGTTVRKATSNDARQVGLTLARALQDDPAMSWAAPDPAKRARYGPRYFELLAERTYMPKDGVYMTDDGMAAALWAPPDEWQVNLRSTLPFLPVMLYASGRNLPRTFRMFNLMETVHKQQREPHYYLPLIGTDPASQGRGLGTALLTHMLERCDSQGVAAYLESTDPRNQALYFRHGFEVIDELRWPGGGPPFWPMWRKSR